MIPVSLGAQVYTDENRSYIGLQGSYQHEAVKRMESAST